MQKNIILILLAILPVLSFAQFDEKSMYECYLGKDKQLWKEYVTTANWEEMDNNERQRLLNYEYGYIAYAISLKDKSSKLLLDNFNRHIVAMAGQMPESTRMTYMSAACSYAVSLNKITILSNGPKTFSYSDRAVALDENDPYALILRGSIYFYCPPAFGGDKHQALKYLSKAENIFKQKGLTKNNWNYRAAQMIIAQCYEKTGEKQKAIDKCRLILQEEPDFLYIRDQYLPELLGLKSPENNPNNPGAAIVSGLE